MSRRAILLLLILTAGVAASPKARAQNIRVREADGRNTGAGSAEGGITVINIFIPGISGAPGEIVRLRPAILVSPVANVTMPFSYTITFDRSLLSPINSGAVTASGNLRTLTVYDTLVNGFPSSHTLTFLIGLGTHDSTLLVPAGFVMAGFTGQATYTNGVFHLTGVCDSGGERLFDGSVRASLAAASPNPAASVAHIAFTLSEVGRSVLEVYDAFGRRVATLFDQQAEPGAYQVDLPTSSLGNGAYFYMLQTPSQHFVHKLLIAR